MCCSSDVLSSDVGVLLLSPEQLDRTGQHLVGLQAMRVRPLKLMGFRVMLVDMSKANKLQMHPKHLREYLQTQYSEALSQK